MNPQQQARQVLGCDPHCTFLEARLAYLRLAKQHHPDKTASSTTSADDDDNNTHFLRIQRAWEEIRRAHMAARAERSPQMVDLDDMHHRVDAEGGLSDEEGEGFEYQCRCGSVIFAPSVDLEQGINTYSCDGCSLSILIMFEMVID